MLQIQRHIRNNMSLQWKAFGIVSLLLYHGSPSRGHHIGDKCSNQFVNISVSLSVYTVLDVNEQNQEVRLHQRLDLTWVDSSLLNITNTSQSASGIHFVDAKQICFPEIFFAGSIHLDSIHSSTFNHEVAVDTNTGTVYVIYPHYYVGRCTMNMENYPFDSHVCYVTVMPLVRNSLSVEMNPINFRYLKDFDSENQEWKVAGTKMEKAMLPFLKGADLIEHQSMAMFVFVIERIPDYYICHSVVPLVVVCFVAIIGFFNPASTSYVRQDKVRLGMMALLAIAMQMGAMQTRLPTSSKLPLLSKFCMGIILLITSGSAISVVIIRIERRRRVNTTLYRFVTGPLATLCCHHNCVKPSHRDRINVSLAKKSRDDVKENTRADNIHLQPRENVEYTTASAEPTGPTPATSVPESSCNNSDLPPQNLCLFCDVLDCTLFILFIILLTCLNLWFVSHSGKRVDVNSGEYEEILLQQKSTHNLSNPTRVF